MFHQVKVNEECGNLLHFPLQENKMTTLWRNLKNIRWLYIGSELQPHQAAELFHWKATANDNGKQIGSAAANFIPGDFYVDNGSSPYHQ